MYSKSKRSAVAKYSAHQGREELKYWRPNQRWYHSTICGTVVCLSKLILGKLNYLTFEGKDRWDRLFGKTGESWADAAGRGLLSFSNHVSLFDDPLLLSNLSVTKFEHVRWIAADHINFFGNNLKGFIYSGGKCVPIIRGGGLDQPGFDFLIKRLKEGDWVHIFPEGGRSRESNHCLQLPLKLGIGKLMYEAKPVVMPFYHYGMHHVLPIGKLLPRIHKNIVVRFGQSSVLDEEWWQSLLTQDDPVTSSTSKEKRAWHQATEWATEQLLELEKQVHPLKINQDER